jgi:hypothetical protein
LWPKILSELSSYLKEGKECFDSVVVDSLFVLLHFLLFFKFLATGESDDISLHVDNTSHIQLKITFEHALHITESRTSNFFKISNMVEKSKIKINK